ncbi:TIGR04282 family arsenosugar biosynthesis glycosyltransferase [Gordonia soli]|uniref:Glycosyltransferase n=1 Tax=Gordonia soli NBRC 108243 TaxID=1223545 RepID=M0QDB8_9ACTN|nr:DUF2064 domain-containing protein [Gordonia soli]GAC66570.1 hypothetical protein GS4_03_00170 [Gordonia soli NBRC 108243]
MSAGILIVAKAPVPGRAKTRLIPRFGALGAAHLAAAAFLDTLRAARAVREASVVVACTGRLSDGVRGDELSAELAGCRVIAQRGDDFGTRLANAHRDAVELGVDTVLQVGMDTPQVGADEMAAGVERLAAPGVDAVLAPACDGGWWALGLHDGVGSELLPSIRMSQADTASETEGALRASGLRVAHLGAHTDVDVPDDVDRVAGWCTADSEFVGALTKLLGDQRIAHDAAG